MTNATQTETKKPATAHAQVAKLIRADLKAAFPGMKFSVRSESFSMGDAVTVSWTNGPAVGQVSAVVDKYQAGDFDGMTDSYNFRTDAPKVSVKFVSCNQSIDPALYARVQADIAAKFSGTSIQISDMAYRALRHVDLRLGYAGIAFVDGRCVVVTGADPETINVATEAR